MPSTPKHFTDSRSTNFYYSFLFLPPEKRRAIEAVYYFARHSDDAADDPQNIQTARNRLERYRTILDEVYRDAECIFEDPAIRELARSIHRFNIPRQPFDDLLLGVEMDLGMDQNSHRYRTFQDLDLYCYRVASTIGLIAIEIFGYRNSQTREYAVHLGKALQTVNILRDVHSDAQRGRVYLPLEDLERFDVDPSTFARAGYNANFIRLMRFESDRAIGRFLEARRLLPAEDRRSMIPAEIMGAIYWRLMQEIQRRSYNVFGPPVRLSRPAKLATALKVYLGSEWQK
jgi:phytoene synthase